WEQVAQTMTGLCHEGRTAARPNGPALLPAAACDYTTGYLPAYGILLALAKRARDGGSYHVRVSLCQSGMFIYRQGNVAFHGLGGGVQEVTIARLSSHTGAEVRGVELTRPLQPTVRERLTRAFVEHSVLVVRDQKLDAPQFLAAMLDFGEIFPQHNARFAVPEC